MKTYCVILLFCTTICTAQVKKANMPADSVQIKNTIFSFLRWYKVFLNTKEADYRFIKNQQSDKYPPSIDRAGVEKYFNHFRQTGLVTEAYISTLRDYFNYVDKMMEGMKPQHDLVKIEGMDVEFVFKSFEPGEILDHIDEVKITQCHIIYRKALIELHVSKFVDLVFSLTKNGNKWQIEYVAGDAFKPDSFFAQ